MKIHLQLFIGVGLVAFAIGYLIFNAIRTTSEYHLTVSEMAARQSDLGGQALRVAGRVKAGTINWEPNTLTLKFEIVPIPDLDASGAPLQPVSAVAAPIRSLSASCPQVSPSPTCSRPAAMLSSRANSAPTALAATQVVTSCPSKYKPRRSQ